MKNVFKVLAATVLLLVAGAGAKAHVSGTPYAASDTDYNLNWTWARFDPNNPYFNMYWSEPNFGQPGASLEIMFIALDGSSTARILHFDDGSHNFDTRDDVQLSAETLLCSRRMVFTLVFSDGTVRDGDFTRPEEGPDGQSYIDPRCSPLWYDPIGPTKPPKGR